MLHNEKYHTKSHIRRSNTQDKVFIAFIVLLMALIFGGLLSGCATHKASQLLANNDWPEHQVEIIKQGQIRIGFTKDQVRCAWGEPVSVNSTISKGYYQEQWVYGSYSHLVKNRYVYFDSNGIVETIQR